MNMSHFVTQDVFIHYIISFSFKTKQLAVPTHCIIVTDGHWLWVTAIRKWPCKNIDWYITATQQLVTTKQVDLYKTYNTW